MKVSKNTTAFVVGGGAGIGAAIAIRLAKEGARIVIGDIADRDIEATCAAIKAAGGNATGYHVDIADEASVAAFAEKAMKSHSAPDLLLNTVVHYKSVLGNIEKLDMDVWRRCIDVNLLGYLRVIGAILPNMIARGTGTVALTASTAALLPGPAMPIMINYYTIKHALLGLASAMAVALKDKGIRMMVFCPTGTATRNAIESVEESFPEFADMMRNAATPESAADVFMAGLLADDFVVCAHPDYEKLIVRLAQLKLDPVRFVREYDKA